MNKYIEKVEKYKKSVCDKALAKLQEDYVSARDSYADTGYDKYFKKMSKCEVEIKELEDYLTSKEKTDITTTEYKELLELRQKMKIVKSKVFYLTKDLPMSNVLMRLNEMLKDIRLE